MYLVCGEALFDFFSEEDASGLASNVNFKAIAGGSPFNVAVGLRRLGVVFTTDHDLAGIGEDIAAGDPLCMVHAATEAAAEQAIRAVQAAYVLAEVAPADPA